MLMRRGSAVLSSASTARRALSSSAKNWGTLVDGDRFRFLSPLNARKSKGVDILNDPLWNKGTAFTPAERDRLKLRGLLPTQVKTLEEQKATFLTKLRAIDDPLQKSLMLTELQCRNATLFHRVMIDEIEEIAPLVYTPTVGLVCQQFSENYTKPWAAAEDRTPDYAIRTAHRAVD